MSKIAQMTVELSSVKKKSIHSKRSHGLQAIPRGIRNNNPGNIVMNRNNAWEGRVPLANNTDGRFEQFTTYAYGVRALIMLLRTYINSGRNTIESIFRQYAPAGENNTQQYIDFVARRLGVAANAPLTLSKETLKALSQSIGRMENGSECISDEQFEAGWNLLASNVRSSIAQSLLGKAFDTQPALPTVSHVNTDEEEGELDGTVTGVSMSLSIPSYCTINPANDASTTNFTLAEFKCHDANQTLPPVELRGNIQVLMNQLEVLRAELGVAIHINSGYRTPEYNATLSGAATSSQHLCGKAADITARGFTPLQIRDKIEELIAAGRMMQGGLGLYNSFVHYDVRGNRSRWDNRTSRAQSLSAKPMVRMLTTSQVPVDQAAVDEFMRKLRNNEINFSINQSLLAQAYYYGGANSTELALAATYPVQAYQIFQNKDVAFARTRSVMGINSRNDKSDAFRHAFYLALNTQDVGAAIALLFSNAHESDSPAGLEKSMDLFNNSAGIAIAGALGNYASETDVSNEVHRRLLAGELRYISNLDASNNATSSSALIATNL